MGASDLSSDLAVKVPHRLVELELTGLIYLSALKKKKSKLLGLLDLFYRFTLRVQIILAGLGT